MRTWTATATTPAAPEDVLAVLIDPVAATRWAPVDFEVDGAGDRLRVGTPARVSGRLAGRDVGFTVEIHHADADRLALTADGPVGLDVLYDFAAVDGGTEVRASVSVRSGGGLGGRIFAQATAALLSAGALPTAVSRIAREAACC
jgi:Polyketide cyclase / dehydrase and lipid transport